MPKINFEFGRKKTTVKDYVILTIVLNIIVTALAKLLRTDEKKVFALLDEWQRNHWPNWLNGLVDRNKVNDYFINTPELLDARVDRDVDAAIADYESEVGTQDDIEIGTGTFFEEEPDGSKAQDLLGGEIGITADWRDQNRSGI